MEEDGYSISKPLRSNINPAHLDFSDDNARHKKASVDDFWEAMAEGSVGLPGGITLSETLDPWISHRGYPIVRIVRNYDGGSAAIRQRTLSLIAKHKVYLLYGQQSVQERFTYDHQSSSSDTQSTWYVPLDYINKTSGDWSSPTKTWLHPEMEMVLHNVAAQDSWVVFNVNKTGYYRVHYDEENWRLLAQALEENPEVLPPETRASLVDDVLGLAAVGLTKYATALDFIKYMQMGERHYAPWGVLMRHLLKLNGLLYETSGFSGFQEFTLRFTSQLYSDVGWNIDEGSRLTLTAVTIACAFENAECLEWSRNNFAKLKDHPDVLLSELLEGKMYNEEETQRILRSFPQNPVAAQIAYKFVRNNWQVIVTSEDNHETIKIVGYTMAMVEAHANFAIMWLKESLPEIQEWLTANNFTEIST
ncbi:Thyrotropin-releasing hormone-degrading ectoenzyme [Harpegnathos saltator]|uniref:Thyrotropin-releasing hormone-degrading ectoenzyme n=1 Tax=Harpegnathos saltator TaxID=610380 RepID=E2C7E7_HARSA|nr:Thyrotropin-releasing hormone-degrading ectoenzyme [Harpegnathos saltator]